MTIASRWSAGPGAPGLLLDLLAAEGWTAEPGPSGNATCASPDGTLIIVFGSETLAYHRGGSLWTVTHAPVAQPDPAPCDCGSSHPARRWTATFGDEVPVEAIAAFLTDLIGPAPLAPHRADQYPAEPLESMAN